MDTGKLEDASSSPNDRRIVRVQNQGAVGEVTRIDLSDGSSFFLPSRLAEAEGLRTGADLSPTQMERLSRLSEAYAARKKALDLLAVREQSRARLEMKLLHRSFSSDAIRAALDELEGSGALDDARFARMWVATRARRNPCGRNRLYADLLNQGVSRLVAEDVLREWSDDDEQDALRRAAERLSTRANTTRDKALRSLLAKGFALAAAKRILEFLDGE